MYLLFSLLFVFLVELCAMPQNVRVAFAGDFGLPSDGQHSHTVLRLIETNNANFTVMLGDYSYVDESVEYPDAGISDFLQLFDDYLGADHPVFPVVGNHDDQDWWQDISEGDEFDGFGKRFWNRLISQNLTDLDCTPGNGEDFGVLTSCKYMGIHMILSGMGTERPKREVDELEFIDEMFYESDSHWKICAFHEVMRLFQVGDEDNGMESYDIYERCRKSGALLATAHEHSYARSKNIIEFSDFPVYLNETGNSPDAPLILHHGISANFVAGTGGKDLRKCVDTFSSNEWWAKAICNDKEANPIHFGALFCDFYINNDPGLARCFFQEADDLEKDPPFYGEIRDEFYLRTLLYNADLTNDIVDVHDAIIATPNAFTGSGDVLSQNQNQTEQLIPQEQQTQNQGSGEGDLVINNDIRYDSTSSSETSSGGTLASGTSADSERNSFGSTDLNEATRSGGAISGGVSTDDTEWTLSFSNI